MRSFSTLFRSPNDAASGSSRKSDKAVAEDAKQIEKNLEETRATGESESSPQKPSTQEMKKQPVKKKKSSQVGDFKLLKKLGQGGMGEVYLAHQISP